MEKKNVDNSNQSALGNKLCAFHAVIDTDWRPAMRIIIAITFSFSWKSERRPQKHGANFFFFFFFKISQLCFQSNNRVRIFIIGQCAATKGK